jgi:hypothetical protein
LIQPSGVPWSEKNINPAWLPSGVRPRRSKVAS